MTISQQDPISPENEPTPPEETPGANSEIEFTSAQQEVLRLLGWFYLINGKYEHSLELLTALHRMAHFNVSTVKMLCYAWLKCGNFAKALFYCDLLQELVYTPEEKIVANLLKSRALWGNGRREEANELMRLVIADRKEMRDVIV